MKTLTEEIETAQRRGARIMSLNAGKEIPFPETAVADARPSNVDDERVLTLLRGREAIPGADIFPPAKMLLANRKPTNALAHAASSPYAANERDETMLAIGPVCFA